MNKLKVSFLTYPGAPKKIINKGVSLFENAFSKDLYEISNQEPDVLFVLTGGSENQASQLVKSQKFVLIVAYTAENSYAASSEIKSFLDVKNINSLLINIDFDNLALHLDVLYNLKNALAKFQNYNLGLIGNISDWLINSGVDSSLIKQKLGINLKKVDWENRDSILGLEVDQNFINYFESNSEIDLTDSSRVYQRINQIIQKNELDAITVECFPLVQDQKVTACLSLSKFLDDGIPAGCEGDLTSILGMILIKEIFKVIPWMANLVSVEKNEIFLAHCTIATKLLSSYKINTHFESGLGTAIQGKYKSTEVTLFRINSKLEKVFITTGKLTATPVREDACRTQIKIDIPDKDAIYLKNYPLGNHHLIVEGNQALMLKILFEMLNFELVNI